MLPDKGLQSLNSLIQLLSEYMFKRESLHELHRQRARATFVRLHEGSPERLLAEGMYQSFFYEFDEADQTINLVVEQFPHDPTYVRNMLKLLNDGFRFTDLLRFVGDHLRLFEDDIEYLVSARDLMLRNGFFETADQITQMLSKLGNKPSDAAYSQGMLSATQAYGLTDEGVAAFLDCGLKPFREFLKGKPTISYVRSTEHVVEDPPELLSFTFYMSGSFEHLMEASEASLNAISAETFDESIDRRLVLSFNDLSFDLEDADAVQAVS